MPASFYLLKAAFWTVGAIFHVLDPAGSESGAADLNLRVQDMTTWLGVPAVDGARVGPLTLKRGIEMMGEDPDGWFVEYDSGGLCPDVVQPCGLAEVDRRTREWIASIAALLGPNEMLDAADHLISAYEMGTGRMGEDGDLRAEAIKEATQAYEAARQKAGR